MMNVGRLQGFDVGFNSLVSMNNSIQTNTSLNSYLTSTSPSVGKDCGSGSAPTSGHVHGVRPSGWAAWSDEGEEGVPV